MVLGYGYILEALEIVVMYYQPKAERKTDDFKGVPRKKIKGCRARVKRRLMGRNMYSCSIYRPIRQARIFMLVSGSQQS